MLNGRRDKMLKYIQQKGEAKFNELEQLFSDVSSMTIRRDLENLEFLGKILRVRGGVVSLDFIQMQSEETYSKRAAENMEAKNKIAQKAVNFVESGRSIYFDAGTTISTLAKLLPEEKISTVTCSPSIALELIKNTNSSVTITGGKLNKDTLSVSGDIAVSFINNINIDIAFIGTSGFSLDAGFTNGDYAECELKKIAIKRAKKVILLMDSSKFDKNMLFTFANLDDIDVLITDDIMPDDLLRELEKYNIEIV